jgi:hypothetical protein
MKQYYLRLITYNKDENKMSILSYELGEELYLQYRHTLERDALEFPEQCIRASYPPAL